MRTRGRTTPARRPAQALVWFTLAIVAIFGMVALTLDLGLLFGQRRFDQNGADAAALAAARLLARNVAALNNSGDVYFNYPDRLVYQVVRKYAGLDPANAGSSDPTGINQNAGLSSRNQLAVSLEYWNGVPDAFGNPRWCYSPSGPEPPRSPPVPKCTLPTDIFGERLPPYPDRGSPYRVRVTVSSTTDAFIAPVIGADNVGPGVATSQQQPACLRPGGDAGMLTCAQAVATISGSPQAGAGGAVIPVTTGDCQVASAQPGALFELWGSNPDGCGWNVNPWKNMLDFTAEDRWCNEPSGGTTSNPDYKFVNLLPIAPYNAYGHGGQCTYDPQYDNRRDWDREGFQPDPDYRGKVQTDFDVPYWIARGFAGTIKPSWRYQDVSGTPTWANWGDGNKFPTYVDANPAQGANLGQNVAVGFYCSPSGLTDVDSVLGGDCTENPAGTYFFARNQPGFYNVCPPDDRYGQQFGVGCRDASVPTWSEPEWATGLNNGGSGWNGAGGGGAPDRVRVMRILNLRIYCDHDVNGLCTLPPKSVVGNAANSSVWGLFLAPLVESGPGSGGPMLEGNVVNLAE